MSIHPDLRDKILFYLLDKKTPCVKGEAFSVKQVWEGAKHILEVFDHHYKKPRSAPSSASTSFRSLPSAPPIKSEILEVLNAIHDDGTKPSNGNIGISDRLLYWTTGLSIPTGWSVRFLETGSTSAGSWREQMLYVSRISSFPQPLSGLIGVHPGWEGY